MQKQANKLHNKLESILELPIESIALRDSAEILSLYETDSKNGLEKDVAAARLQELGKNICGRESRINPVRLFFHQFESTVVVLLLLAAGASLCFHEELQAAGIIAAVLINAITGFYMEYKAGVSLSGLKALSGLTVRCLRQGEQLDLPVSELVPGDIVILEAGARVPADIRLLEAAGLSVDESALTGESVPVFKDLSLNSGESLNLLFHGSIVASGRGRGVVVKTGLRSSLGKLGILLEQTETGETPLERQLEHLGRQLSILTVVICSIVSVVGILHREDIFLMVQTGIALAVAAIPEGLPVLATLALAVGTQRMVRNRAILRQLSAVETLGCTSVICSDKTGTLTENKMTVCKIFAGNRMLEVTGTGYAPQGSFIENGVEKNPLEDPVFKELLMAGALCNDAELENGDSGEGWHVHGDPTEGALLTLLMKTGINPRLSADSFQRYAEFPFDLTRKRMTTIHRISETESVAYTKGSPGSTIGVCSRILTKKGEELLTEETLRSCLALNEKFAEAGLRVLALARKSIGGRQLCLDLDAIESEMTLIGLVGIKDPLRDGVKEAVAACARAGIKVIMLTGDQALTAGAIARELDILKSPQGEGELLTGKELQGLKDSDACEILKNARVLARVTPELKLNIVKILQSQHGIVSMTGDGVNDAPALKQANIGVAMGLKGTDLARSVSKMVITDDNFATIVKAIEQGRVIYTNIQRAVGYLLTASLSSVITVALGIVCDLGLPLTPLQLLWLNLIMHIFPGLGIVLQKGEKSIMDRPPRDPDSKIVSASQRIQIIMRSTVVSLAVLASIRHAELLGIAADHITTVGLCTLSLCLLLQAWSWMGVDDYYHDKYARNVAVGSAMLFNMTLAYALLFSAIYLPWLNKVLATVPLDADEILYCLGVSSLSLLLSILCQRLLGLFRRAAASA